MTITVRPAMPETDFGRLAALIAAAWPLDPIDEATLRDMEARSFEGMVRRRFAAVEGGEIWGYAVVAHYRWHEPGYFYLWVTADAARRGQGVGSALYRAALAYACENGATSLGSEVLEQDEVSLRVTQHAGFRVDRHIFESTLQLSTFDEEPYRGLIDRLEAEGIRFFSLAECDTPQTRQGLYEVNRQGALDIPGSGGDFWGFEDFTRIVFEANWFFPQGQILAAHGDRIVGLAALSHHPGRDYLYNEMTAVLPAYRGRGIPTALKLQAIRTAHNRGISTLRTNNDSENGPMLAINRKLGYRAQPGYYKLVRDCLD